MKAIMMIALLVGVGCAKPAAVVEEEPLVPAEAAPSPLEQCCIDAGGTPGAGCPGADTASYAECAEHVAVLETICPEGSVLSTGCTVCPPDIRGDGAGPLTLDGVHEVTDGRLLRLAQVSGCGEGPQSIVINSAVKPWTRVGEAVAGTCKALNRSTFVCREDKRILEIDLDENAVSLGARSDTGIRLSNVGKVAPNKPTENSSNTGVARIVPGRAVVHGSLDKEIIRRIVRQHRRELKQCYEEHLRTFPDYAGKVVVKFVITADGDVIKPAVVERTTEGQAFEQCVLNKIQRWRFPQPKGGGIVIVKYPFHFST